MINSKMLGMMAYLGVCAVAAAILTLVYALVRPIRSRGEMRSWRVMFGFFVVVTLAPYGWSEALTRMIGKDMKPVVEAVMAEAEIEGELRFYRVLTFRNETARVIAVSVERQSWGGTERPVVAMTLVRQGDEWSARSFNVVTSGRLNKDSFTFPPYW